ncbi:HNH endonuclease signature motif containing protein [Corynebacterium kozikiae]|uniref:HNH endonuclease signature motif containing protein n=1 Tax=Corynebacterium kozikiae TaxID=2968469 RepID=UPI00211C132C|nr:HNH endonuclease signature motif containing protein [Corynebacterium sp. 76QC2CO]MCQ9342836.1 HNH endonuclease [Corynebacterium sp. 76QC2CO]
MNTFDVARAYTGLGVDFLVDVARAARSMPRAQLAETLGMETSEVGRLLWIHGFYTGAAVKRAAKGYGLGVLRVLASAVNQLTAKDVSRDEVLIECLKAVAGMSVDKAKAQAIAIVREHNLTGVPVKRLPKAQTQKKADAAGQRRLMGQFADADLTQVEQNLAPRVRQLMKNEGMEHAQAFAVAMLELLKGGQPHTKKVYMPLLFLPLRPSEGYFSDGHVYTADGCGVPLHELDGVEISDTGFVIVSAANEKGEIMAEALPIRRFANDGERLVMRTELMICPHPDCDMPAWKCQYHHIQAWSNGGATVIENMMLLCRPHNAANDDGDRDKNGRMFRDARGRPAFRRHDKAPPEYNSHPATKKGWRAEAELHAEA